MSLLPGAVDRLFLRFCRRGDTDALAAVFDRVAPELLRVAAYLAGNRADAEDLLQRTFLAAIESRAAYDPRRRAMPWLLGILANHVQRLRRERARRAPVDAPSPAAARDPAAAAADRELEVNVAQLREELGSPYREVLELHLEQGLNAKEIAARLGRPAGTVRTQLVRALEQLRRRLPSGFVAAVVPFAPTAPTLAKIKAAVVSAADATAPLAAPAAVGWMSAMAGGAVVGKKVLVLVPVFAAALGVGVHVAWPQPQPAVRSEPAAAVSPAAASGPAVSREEQRVAAAPTAAAPQREPAAAPPAAIGPAVIRGRCVDEGGNPLAGCKARLESSVRNATDRERLQGWRTPAGDAWRGLEPVTTAADGRFEFRFVPPPMLRYHLRLSRADRVSMTARWQAIAAGDDIQLPDAVMRGGTRVRGRVVDEAGGALAGLFVDLDLQRPAAADGELRPEAHLGQQSDAAGRFMSYGPLPPGDYVPSVLEHEVSSPKRVQLLPGQADADVQITLRLGLDGGVITGNVVDDRGSPIGGAIVRSVPEGAVTRTAKDGSFRVVRRPEMAKTPVRLQVDDQRCEPRTTTDEHAWNTGPVRIGVTRGVELEVQARAADGSAVEDYGVLLFSHVPGMGVSSQAHLEATGHHAGGIVHLPDLRRGPWLLAVVPGDPQFATTQLQEVLIEGDGRQRLQVIVPRAAQRVLQVLDGDGKPVAGIPVRLADAAGGRASASSLLLPLTRWESTNAPGKAVLLHEAHTVADGSVVLHGPDDRLLELLLPGPPNLPQVVHAVSLAVTEPLAVTVTIGASLACTVRPAGARAQLLRMAGLPADAAVIEQERSNLPAFRFRAADGTLVPSDNEPAVELGGDGSFRIDGVPPGKGSLLVYLTVGYGAVGRMLSGGEDVATFDVQAGAQQCEIDLSRFLPGDLQATVLHNGAPFANARLMVNRFDAEGRFASGLAALTDASGQLRLCTPAGTYRFEFGSGVRAPEPVRIVAGETTTTNFTFVTGCVELTLVDADGAAVAQLAPTLQPLAGEHWLSLRPTDQHGHVRAEVPPGRYVVKVLPKRLLDAAAMRAFVAAHGNDVAALQGEMRGLGELEIAVGVDTKATLQLPADWSR